MRQRLRDPVTGLLFVLPVLVLFLIFRIFPSLGAAGMSLTNWNIGGDWDIIGADNYVRLLDDVNFWLSLRVTLVYSVVYVPLTMLVALGTALLLNQVVFMRGLFRGMLFLPYVTSFVLAGIIWRWIYEFNGLINGLLAKADLGPVAFLEESGVVLPALAVVAVWKGFGYSMLILLAGLKAIPSSYLEAASIDGASPWQRFRRITLPLLKPAIFFVMVIETISAFQTFDTVYVMTGGGPARATYTLIYGIYDHGFRSFDFGYAATWGMVLFAIVLIVSLVQRRFLDRGNT
ncbi:carbohydrate ABC transporter permease [Nonomuraea diastatica]|uniref:Sugar ABC transporter permease n=1 Tax=Nonomuraea diastatica TaxID=1848329 RepID=A0A4R4WWQ0_9ACTN|nr:sugar ABC transporter permease [Nonomuraea diastatica]TDD22125.1 sugar ABC transporter permease [Nonomuraea diastatica]